MRCAERPDDFDARRTQLRGLSDEALHERFWQLAEQVVAPLVAEARTHTTPAIERSVLLRMGFASHEARELVAKMAARGLLGHGAGRLVLEVAKARGLSAREAGVTLLSGSFWEDLPAELAK